MHLNLMTSFSGNILFLKQAQKFYRLLNPVIQFVLISFHLILRVIIW